VLFAGPLAGGWFIDQRWEWSVLSNRAASMVIGAGLIAAGVAVAIAGVRRFRSAHTTVLPFGGTTQIVSSGVYRWTRNPMYLGMALTYVGLSFVLNSGWCLLLLPVSLSLVHYFAIRPEERYLTRKFGDEYNRYRSQVRRWL
jgi:protein-S-isoprenylcysteine O-methyltransferase Ste14